MGGREEARHSTEGEAHPGTRERPCMPGNGAVVHAVRPEDPVDLPGPVAISDRQFPETAIAHEPQEGFIRWCLLAAVNIEVTCQPDSEVVEAARPARQDVFFFKCGRELSGLAWWKIHRPYPCGAPLAAHFGRQRVAGDKFH